MWTISQPLYMALKVGICLLLEYKVTVNLSLEPAYEGTAFADWALWVDVGCCLSSSTFCRVKLKASVLIKSTVLYIVDLSGAGVGLGLGLGVLIVWWSRSRYFTLCKRFLEAGIYLSSSR